MTDLIFGLDEEEYAKYREFKRYHCGQTQIILEPNEIGTAIKFRCASCGKILDVTDTSKW